MTYLRGGMLLVAVGLALMALLPAFAVAAPAPPTLRSDFGPQQPHEMVIVTPNPATVAPGAQQVFRATYFNGTGSPTQENFNWTLSPLSLGTLNATSGPSVTFTAGSTNQTGEITATTASVGVHTQGSATIIVPATSSQSTNSGSGMGLAEVLIIAGVAVVVMAAVVMISLRRR